MARILMPINNTPYSQHQMGTHNDIADILSRYHVLANTELAFFLKHRYNTQMPKKSNISTNKQNKFMGYIVSGEIEANNTVMDPVHNDKVRT